MAGVPLVREGSIDAVAPVHPTLGVVMPAMMAVVMIGVMFRMVLA
jgi:hypothetical protein